MSTKWEIPVAVLAVVAIGAIERRLPPDDPGRLMLRALQAAILAALNAA